ncbi:hypothetical protein [Mariniflexile sp.]|uniref:hypothetical protein n=1 Tax=Mariniflexile sp. TaxID=1979402 RepID=UPI00404798D6
MENLLSEKIPAHYTVTYSDLDVNILSGNIVFNHPYVTIKNKESLQNHINLKLETLQLNGIGYWDLLFNETLSIQNILLKNPRLHYRPYKKNTSKKTETKTNNKGIKTIHIKDFNITNGSIAVMEQSSDSIKLSVSSYNLTISGSTVTLQSSQQNPITYDGYKFNAQNVILNNSEYETFKMDSIHSNEEAWSLDHVQIIPKYDKKELSKHLSKERDHIKLNIPKVVLEKPDFNFDENRFGMKATTVKILDPILEIYRDKLVPDDLSVKPLYSKSLRNLKFDLEINKVEIKNGYISYAELVETDKEAGVLFFNKVDASLNHITNKKNAKKTDITVHSNLMGKAPLELNWGFDVNNTWDAFEVSGAIQDLPADMMNPFFKPNLNALAEGTLQQMYFSFYGNTTESKGEMKMKYEDFKFKILRQNSFKINKVLTAIGNIFIADGSKTDADGYRFGSIKAERNVTKSFFNYLWINVKSGVVSTLTGNGKK